jgi:hypothetical protein
MKPHQPLDYNSDTDRLREIFSVRFGLLVFGMQRGLKRSPIVASQAMGTSF